MTTPSETTSESRHVIITGSTGTIGRALVHAFADVGFFVGLHYHDDEQGARRLLDEIRRNGARGDILGGDLTDPRATTDAVRDYLSKTSPPDVLVNNAGASRNQIFLLVDPESWRTAIETNLSSLHTITQCVLRPMIARRKGSIVNISSLSGLRGLPGQVAYGAAKSGVHGFTRALAREVGRHGIRVNCIAPGAIESPALDAVSPQQQEWLRSATSLGRAGLPEEVAAVAVFLASSAASYITGQILAVDGGII